MGPLINGLISGGYASYKSYVTGGSNTDIFISGVTSAFASVASLSNVARAGKISLSILEASAIDLVNSTGFNCAAVAIYQGVNYDNKGYRAKTVSRTMKTMSANRNMKRSKTKSKSSALSKNGCSVDYFKYLLNGGKPY